MNNRGAFLKTSMLSAALMLGACGAPGTGDGSSALSGEVDNCLQIDLVSDEAACPKQAGELDLDYIVRSTHGTGTATVTVRIDGGASIDLDTISSGEWTTDNGTSAFEGTAKLPLSDGTHTILLCVVQGVNHDCAPAFDVTVDCSHSACNQGVGNGPEGCDPGNSDHNQPSNDENGGVPGKPGRAGVHVL